MKAKNSNEKKIKVANRSTSRLTNQKAIVTEIYENDGISKAQLSKKLGISKPAVADNVENLISIGIIEERGEGTAAKSGGRKPTLLYLNEKHRYIGALDLSLSVPICSIADLSFQPVGLKKVFVSENSTPEERKAKVRDTFIEILTEQKIPLDKLEIIVISHPGLIETEENKDYYTVERHHKWTKIGLIDYLSKELEVKVSVINDVNAAALGEMNFGLKEKIENLIYVTCGVGLGAGIVIDGQLYEGTKRAAGEMGSILLPNGDRLEELVSITGLIKGLEDRNEELQNLTFSKVIELSKQDNKIIQDAIYETGKNLGRAIYNAGILFDISTIILGGECLELGEKLFAGIEFILKENLLFKPEVIESSLMQTAGLYGCFVRGQERVLNYILI